MLNILNEKIDIMANNFRKELRDLKKYLEFEKKEIMKMKTKKKEDKEYNENQKKYYFIIKITIINLLK